MQVEKSRHGVESWIAPEFLTAGDAAYRIFHPGKLNAETLFARMEHLGADDAAGVRLAASGKDFDSFAYWVMSIFHFFILWDEKLAK